jgi:hypothetical protein
VNVGDTITTYHFCTIKLHLEATQWRAVRVLGRRVDLCAGFDKRTTLDALKREGDPVDVEKLRKKVRKQLRLELRTVRQDLVNAENALKTMEAVFEEHLNPQEEQLCSG